jgi:hypothetical protein
VPFPLDVLPDQWRTWIEASAQAFMPVDYLAQNLFAAVVAVCGGGVMAVVTTQWAEPLVLWQALVGGPSSGKSPALDAARRGLLEQLTDDTDEPDRPAQPAIVLRDWLYSLAVARASNPRGVTLWRDELEDSLAAARRGRDRAEWLAAWTGGCIPLSIVGALRPDRLVHALGAAEEGFAARFVYAWPEATSCGALRGGLADDAAVRAMLRRIAGLAGPATDPTLLAFELDAVAGLEQLLPELRKQMREADGLEAAWLGKGAGTVVRLAGLLTLMHWAEDPATERPGEVTPERLADALRLWSGYFHPHAKSVFQRMGQSAGSGDRDHTARRAVRWLRGLDPHQVSREDIRREAFRRSIDADGADQVIARLEAGGVLRAVAVGGSLGRPRRRWEINPSLR